MISNNMEIRPGEIIGLVVAQQCSAPAVQTSLSAFHQVGSGRLGLGKEYSAYLRLQTSIDDSVTYVYPKDPNSIKEVMFELQNVCLKDLIESYTITSSRYFNRYKSYHPIPIDNVHLGRCLSLKLKKDKMYYYKIDPYQIKHVIESNVYDVVVVPSPLADCTIDILCSNDTAGKLSNLYQGLFQGTKEISTSLRNFQIKGLPNIWPKRIVNNEYIECRGCNIADLVKHPMIDIRRTFTNNIAETYKYYGSIITGKIIRKHLKILFKDDIDDKALKILVSNMLYKGYPIPVSQEGTDAQGRSLLFKMTYERFMDHVQTIPFIGESPVTSIYDKIAVGKIMDDV